jgi:competence protein ComGF
MLVVVICILSVLVVILGFSTFNLLRKQEKAEDVLIEYLAYLDRLSRVVEASDQKLKEIDNKGTFKSDDEIGFFFKSVQQIQDILNEFKVIRIKQE